MADADPTTGASASSEPKLEPKLTEMATNPVGDDGVEKKEGDDTKKETEGTVCCDFFPRCGYDENDVGGVEVVGALNEG
jgi:hypothetical protein